MGTSTKKNSKSTSPKTRGRRSVSSDTGKEEKQKKLTQLIDDEWLHLPPENLERIMQILDNPRPPNEVAKAAHELYLTIPHIH